MKAIKMDDEMEIEEDKKIKAEDRIKEILNKASESNPLNKVNPKERKYNITRQTKPKNQIDQYVEDMIKAEVRELPQIQSFFASPQIRKQISDSEARFYQDLVNSVVYNTRVSVTDLLHGAYFVYYIGERSFALESNVFTNDRLFWISKLSTRLKKRKIYPFLRLNNNNVSLQTLAIAQDKGYRKGYVQDYEKNFSCIGLDSLTNDEKKKLENTEALKTNEIQYYTYNNLDYGCITFKSGCTITFLKDEIDQVVDKIKNVRVLGNKKNLENEIKLFKIKEGKGVYISQNLDLTDFFPCEIIVNNPLNYAFLFKFDIDMLAFENHLHDKFEFTVDEGFDSFFKFKNLIQWNTFDLMVNFLIVEKMTTYKTDDKYTDFRKYIDDFISKYNEIKRDIRDLRKIIDKTLKLLIKFFDSFPTKIKFEKMYKFSEPIRDMYEKLKTEIKKKTPEKFEFLLRDFKLTNTCVTIFNCVRNNCLFMEGVLKKLNLFLVKFRGKQGGTIVEDAKGIGVNIFTMLDFAANKNFLVNVIRTPSVFLGNLLEDDEEFNKGLAKENKKMDKKYDKHKKRNDEIMRLQKLSAEDCIKRFIAIYFYEEDAIEFDDYDFEGNKTIFEGNFGSWFKDEIKNKKGYPNGDYYKKMVAYGAQLLLDNGTDLENLEIDESERKKLNFLIASYKNYKERDDLENKMIINNNKEKINDLKEENINLKENKRNYLKKGEEVTVDFMKERNIDIIDTENEDESFVNFIKFTRENGITDDVVKQIILDSGDYDYKKVLEKKDKNLIKMLQDEALSRHGKEAEDEKEDEDMKVVEEKEKDDEENIINRNKEVYSDNDEDVKKIFRITKVKKKNEGTNEDKLKEKKKRKREARKEQQSVVGLDLKKKGKIRKGRFDDED